MGGPKPAWRGLGQPRAAQRAPGTTAARGKRGRASVTSAGAGALPAARHVRARGRQGRGERSAAGKADGGGRPRRGARLAAPAAASGLPGGLRAGGEAAGRFQRAAWSRGVRWTPSRPRVGVGPFTPVSEREIFPCLGVKKQNKTKQNMTIQWVAVVSFLYAEIGLILIFCLPFIPPQR